MTVFGRLGALFVVLSGASLLLVGGFRSPPSLWYAAIGIVAGTTMMAYTVISSAFSRRQQPAAEPTYSSTSNESTITSTTQQTDSQPVETPETAKSTESTDQEQVPTSDDSTDPPEQPTSEEKPRPSSTTVKVPRRLPKKTQTTGRTASYTNSSRAKKAAGTSFRQNRHVTSTASPRRSPSTETDNQYFKLVDSKPEIKFAQIDSRFNCLDIDWGPEFIGLDPIPDLVEIDVGPSAVSHELVRSPVEIKIPSFLKGLLAPTPHSSDTAAPNASTQPSTAVDNHASRRADDTVTSQESVPSDTYETRYSDQDKRVDRRSLGFKPVIREEPIGPQEVDLTDDPVVNMGMNNSLSQWEPLQRDADSFGLNDAGPGFSEPEESVVGQIEQPELGFGMSDWEPGMLINEPVEDPEGGAEMLGLNEFAEPPEGPAGLTGSDVENRSDPLFPKVESFFLEEDAEDDWLRF
jgi:outer membrane biosynthesis protein TonB